MLFALIHLFYLSKNLWIWLIEWNFSPSWGLPMDWVNDPQHERIHRDFHLLQHFSFLCFFPVSCYRFRFWRLKSIFMQFTTKEIFPGRVIAHLNTRHKANCESTVNDFDTMNQQMAIHRNATRMRYQRIAALPFPFVNSCFCAAISIRQRHLLAQQCERSIVMSKCMQFGIEWKMNLTPTIVHDEWFEDVSVETSLG